MADIEEKTVVKHADGTTIEVTTTKAAGGGGGGAPLFAPLTPDQLLTPVPSDIECSQSITPDHISEVRLLRCSPAATPPAPPALFLRTASRARCLSARTS
jgi:hypothetical protein